MRKIKERDGSSVRGSQFSCVLQLFSNTDAVKPNRISDEYGLATGIDNTQFVPFRHQAAYCKQSGASHLCEILAGQKYFDPSFAWTTDLFEDAQQREPDTDGHLLSGNFAESHLKFADSLGHDPTDIFANLRTHNKVIEFGPTPRKNAAIAYDSGRAGMTRLRGDPEDADGIPWATQPKNNFVTIEAGLCHLQASRQDEIHVCDGLALIKNAFAPGIISNSRLTCYFDTIRFGQS